MQLPFLRKQEKCSFELRALYEQQSYQLYRVGSFEEYDFYMQNKSFLNEEDIITFTGSQGRLMALKPDVTLSIVKNTISGKSRRVYYIEPVYRRSRQTGEYLEINQMGLECIGNGGLCAEAEVLQLAAQSLDVIGDGVLDLSNMSFIDAFLSKFFSDDSYEIALRALQVQSPHGMAQAAEQAGLSEEDTQRVVSLVKLSGSVEQMLQQARELSSENVVALQALDELQQIAQILMDSNTNTKIRLDFSIVNDVDYYNGIIFQGFVQGVSRPVLTGGRYDNLMRRFHKTQGAVGFALYLDTLNEMEQTSYLDQTGDSKQYLNIALPKGRMGQKVYELFRRAGLECEEMLEQSRKLILEDTENKVRYFLVKPSDVDIYVEHGAADIGVVGKDVMSESCTDILELLDLKMGVCRFAVAAPIQFQEDFTRPLRVATKYPNVAREFFAHSSRAVEMIQLHGSIEIAPLLGLSDVIVDIVETGSTLKENNLEIIEEISPSSARLVANKGAWHFKQEKITSLVQKLEALI